MYATNNNSQAIESRSRITDALLVLMKQYPYQLITVTQICQEAEIVRQTYYRNFTSKDDVLNYYLDHMIQQYFTDYYETENVAIQLTSFFSFMLRSREFLILAFQNNLFFMIDRTISTNITKFLNFGQLTTMVEPISQKYVTGFIASTICFLLSLWTESGFDESPEMMSVLGQRLLSGLRDTNA